MILFNGLEIGEKEEISAISTLKLITFNWEGRANTGGSSGLSAVKWGCGGTARSGACSEEQCGVL